VRAWDLPAPGAERSRRRSRAAARYAVVVQSEVQGNPTLDLGLAERPSRKDAPDESFGHDDRRGVLILAARVRIEHYGMAQTVGQGSHEKE
jgi:hypothetical protein